MSAPPAAVRHAPRSNKGLPGLALGGAARAAARAGYRSAWAAYQVLPRIRPAGPRIRW